MGLATEYNILYTTLELLLSDKMTLFEKQTAKKKNTMKMEDFAFINA